MKRCASALVEYESSSEDGTPDEAPPSKKKKLPALSAALVVPAPIDNPALHEGRIRSTPHVDGSWAAHVYVSITINRSHAMSSLLEVAVAEAQRQLPALRSLTSFKGDEKPVTLHISLSRPIFIRAHQKEELRRAVRNLAQHPRFTLSFTSFAELQNDEHTRTFLTLEVGAGHHELKTLCRNLEPILHSLRQPGYYSTPRFHASVAWALLDRALQANEAEGKPTAEEEPTNPIASSDIDSRSTSLAEFPTSAQFAMVPKIPDELVHKLNSEFADRLSSPSVGSFDVKNIFLKIGKDVVSWPLLGVS